MHCRERARRQSKGHEPAAVSGHPKSPAEQGLRRGRAERHDDLRFDDADLRLEPRKAGLDFDRARFAVNAPRTARHPFEMFDDIGDVSLLAVDPRLHETAVQQPSRWSYEGVAGKILAVARLLADQHDPGSLRAFTEH